MLLVRFLRIPALVLRRRVSVILVPLMALGSSQLIMLMRK